MAARKNRWSRRCDEGVEPPLEPRAKAERWRRAQAASGDRAEDDGLSAADEPGATSADAPVECIALRGGVEMPRFGLGTWKSRSGDCRHAVFEALSSGYRLLDTAQVYGNEADVGQAIAESQVDRGDIFLVTKLSSKEHGARATDSLSDSLRRLGTPYVDLFLMHSPRGGLVLETWEAMVAARDAGLARAVGVSNFGVQQLQGLKAAGLELPSVNQIELHIWFQQRETVDYCESEGVALMAYSPLAQGRLFGTTGLRAIADAAGCSEADLCIRWCLQRGFIVIPKSITSARIQSNSAAARAPRLSDQQMAAIAALDQGYCTCPAASAMRIPWDQVVALPRAKRMPARRPPGSRDSQPKRGESWAEALSR